MKSEYAEQLMEFVYMLPMQSDCFGVKTLNLMTECFRDNKFLFCIYPGEDYSRQPMNLAGYEMIGKNINAGGLRKFSTQYYVHDIFACQNIPKKYKNEEVLMIADIMTEEAYKQSKYHELLISVGLYDQLCIRLKKGDRYIGSLSVFRAENEKRFDAEDKELYKLVGKYLSKYFASYSEPVRKFRDYFHVFYDMYDVGAVLLDRNMNILETNAAFRENTEYIIKNGNFDTNTTDSKDIFITDQDKYSQKFITYFGSRILAKPDSIKIDFFRYKYELRTKDIYFADALGNVNILYCVLLIENSKIFSPSVKNILDNELTQRETEVLRMLVKMQDNQLIAEELHISVSTVKTHLQNLYRKFDVTSKTELLARIYGMDSANH